MIKLFVSISIKCLGFLALWVQIAQFSLKTSKVHKTTVWNGIWMGPKKIKNSKPFLSDCSIDAHNMSIEKEIWSKEWSVSKKAILGH